MLPILIACSIWLPALVGLGSPLSRSLRRASGAVVCSIAVRTAITGLLGMFVASTVAAAANFFVPVYPWVSSGILLSGWLLLMRDCRSWTRLPGRAWRLPGVVLLVVALIDARGLPWYDTGLYHLQAVQWITSNRLPLGLANLYTRLGTNSSWFSFAAAIEAPFLLNRSCFIVNALLAVLIALVALDALLRLGRAPLRPDRILLILMLIPLAYFGIDVGMISSLAPDPAVAVLILFSIALWVRSSRFAPHIFALACFAITIKLSAAPLGLIALLTMIAFLSNAVCKMRRLILVAGFSVLAGIVFLIRGIWLSGYPAFPSQFGRVAGLSWTVPTASAMRTEREIEYWARYHQVYERVFPGTPWLTGWLKSTAMSQPMLLAYIIFVTGACLWFYRRPALTSAAARGVFAFIALLPAIAFWFLTSPLVRFGYGYVFGAAAVSMAIGVGGWVVPSIHPQTRRFVLTGAIAGLLLFARVDRHLLKATWLRWPAIPTAALVPHTTADGLVVQMPREGDRVWNAPVPATPELDPHLRCERDSSGKVRRFFIE